MIFAVLENVDLLLLEVLAGFSGIALKSAVVTYSGVSGLFLLFPLGDRERVQGGLVSF